MREDCSRLQRLCDNHDEGEILLGQAVRFLSFRMRLSPDRLSHFAMGGASR